MIEEIELTEAIAEDVAFSGEVLEKLTLLAHPGLGALENSRKVVLTLVNDPNKSVADWAYCCAAFWNLPDAKEIFFSWMEAGDFKKALILVSTGELEVVDNAVIKWLANKDHKPLRYLLASNSTLAQSPVAAEVALILARDPETDVRAAIGSNLWLADLPEADEISLILGAQTKKTN